MPKMRGLTQKEDSTNEKRNQNIHRHKLSLLVYPDFRVAEIRTGKIFNLPRENLSEPASSTVGRRHVRMDL